MSLSFKNEDAFAAAEKWPQNQLMLITNKAGCNPSNERGAYLLVNHERDEKTLTMKCKVKSQMWKDIAEWMQPSYGHIASGRTYATAYTTAPVSKFPYSSTLVKTALTSKAGYVPYSAPKATSIPVQHSSVHGYGYEVSSSVKASSTTVPGGYKSPTTISHVTPTPSAHPAYCPSGYSAGSLVRGGVTYDMNCGKKITYTGVSIASGGPSSGIKNMGDCMDWCNRHGGYCKVAIWDHAKHDSCRLLSSSGGATSYCSTGAFATRP